MRKTLLLEGAACRAPSTPQSDYLFVWAGDSADKSSDFLAVIDAKWKRPHLLPDGKSVHAKSRR